MFYKDLAIVNKRGRREPTTGGKSGEAHVVLSIGGRLLFSQARPRGGGVQPPKALDRGGLVHSVEDTGVLAL